MTALAAGNPEITEVRFLKERNYGVDADGKLAEGADLGFADEHKAALAALAAGNPDITEVRFL